MESISLGWNCDSAQWGQSVKIRKTKAEGYKTCPFDLILSNYRGIIDCIKDDFKYFCDINYLEIKKIPKESKLLPDEELIYNTKYNFMFNHESPGHGGLYITQEWSKGINHFVLNNYEEFIIRYNRRIQNFRDYLNSGKKINFIIHRPRVNPNVNEILELYETITNKYPNLNYEIILLEPSNKQAYIDHHSILMNFTINDEELKRLM